MSRIGPVPAGGRYRKFPDVKNGLKHVTYKRQYRCIPDKIRLPEGIVMYINKDDRPQNCYHCQGDHMKKYCPTFQKPYQPYQPSNTLTMEPDTPQDKTNVTFALREMGKNEDTYIKDESLTTTWAPISTSTPAPSIPKNETVVNSNTATDATENSSSEIKIDPAF